MVAGERFLMLSKTDGNSPTFMYFARACVRAHACTRADKQEEACTR